MKPEETAASQESAHAWRRPGRTPSLAEAHRTVPVPTTLSFWRKMLAFSGPGYLVAVGYMDPGNWATDLAGGSAFGYTLLSVILLSNLMAILLQSLAARLGIVTGRDLAQACRDHYSRPVSVALWILCEVAICACDLAEVIGSAIALNLLFKIPLVWGVCVTALDVLAVMFLQNKGFRYIEALVITLITLIGGLFRHGNRAREAQSRGSAGWLHSQPANRPQHRHALHRHRHPRRDGHAAQSLPALLDRADAQIRADAPAAKPRPSSSPRSTRRWH